MLPEDWRRPVLGRASMGSNAWKQAAIVSCKHMFKVDVGDDEAEAILIGYWASLATELRPLMPKKIREEHR